MAEYIDREEYCEKHCRCSNEYCDKERCPICKAPTVDAEVVVRCKDCEYSYNISGRRHCSHGICCGRAVPPDFYCAEGKERSLTNDSRGGNNA